MVTCLERSADDLHYGPADATAIVSSLASLKSRMVYFSAVYLLTLRLNDCYCSC